MKTSKIILTTTGTLFIIISIVAFTSVSAVPVVVFGHLISSEILKALAFITLVSGGAFLVNVYDV